LWRCNVTCSPDITLPLHSKWLNIDNQHMMRTLCAGGKTVRIELEERRRQGRFAVITDLDDSLITSHASGKDRCGWEPVIKAFADYAAKGVRLHIVTLNGAPFISGICNGMSHHAAEAMLGDVHVGEGNVTLVVRGPGEKQREWCEIPIGNLSVECELDRVLVRRIVARAAPDLFTRSVGMSAMVSYCVYPDSNRSTQMRSIQAALNKALQLRTSWTVREGGHPHIIDIVPEHAADKGKGIVALLAHAEKVGQTIDVSNSAWFGDSNADILALEELTSARRLSEGNAIGFVATHAGASRDYITAVLRSPVPHYVSSETLAENAVPEMLVMYDRVIGLGVRQNGSGNRLEPPFVA
jgi:hypothetical protein